MRVADAGEAREAGDCGEASGRDRLGYLLCRIHDLPYHYGRQWGEIERSGMRCRAPAVRETEVCRMHWAAGGAPTGNRNAGVGKRGLCPLADVDEKRGLFGNLGPIFGFLGLALLAKSGDKRGLPGDFCPVGGFVRLALLAEFGDKRRPPSQPVACSTPTKRQNQAPRQRRE